MRVRFAAVPNWAAALVPVANLLAAGVAAGVVILAIYWGRYDAGSLSLDAYLATPLRAAGLLVSGAFGSPRNLSYSLFYATDFIFTGLAVAVAAHAGLFNIGAEGQGYIAGFGVALVCLHLDTLPAIPLALMAVVAAMAFGAAWAFIPGYLQARRGSHVVITTIMFNFIASSFMVYLLVHVLVAPGRVSPESPRFAPNATLMTLTDLLRLLGVPFARVPLNVSFLLALLCALGVWLFVWRTRWGYALRTVGFNPRAAVYGGISVPRVTVAVMCLSGALAGLMAMNEVMGAQQRLVLNFTAGAGFVGVAVALMGRNHPFGIILAAILFGALYQGGTSLSFAMPEITRDLVVVIQGLVILFTGALEHVFRRPLEAIFRPTRAPAPA